MKTTFGSPFSRILGASTTLTAFERTVLERLVAALPDFLRETVEAQFESYVLVQREVDGRALNFYPRKGATLPLLRMAVEQAPLIRLSLSVNGRLVHAVLAAVGGRAFCVSFGEDARPFGPYTSIDVVDITRSWKSNFHMASNQPLHPDALTRAGERRR
jgi:hypothetical protein